MENEYRKRPIVIKAEQFIPGVKPWPIGVEQYVKEAKEAWRINTLEGIHEVTPGDWIITGVKGERYACKTDIFALTYEKVTTKGVENKLDSIGCCPKCGYLIKDMSHQSLPELAERKGCSICNYEVLEDGIIVYSGREEDVREHLNGLKDKELK